jgi:hypothetical protein
MPDRNNLEQERFILLTVSEDSVHGHLAHALCRSVAKKLLMADKKQRKREGPGGQV